MTTQVTWLRINDLSNNSILAKTCLWEEHRETIHVNNTKPKYSLSVQNFNIVRKLVRNTVKYNTCERCWLNEQYQNSKEFRIPQKTLLYETPTLMRAPFSTPFVKNNISF